MLLPDNVEAFLVCQLLFQKKPDRVLYVDQVVHIALG